MKLPGQGARLGVCARRADLDDGGYIMVALLVGIAVSAIWISALLPTWGHQVIREKEEELIFRGTQCARAIALFYAKNNRALPMDIDTLVSQKYLRKKWKDPITGKDFVLVRGGAPSATPSGTGQRQGQVSPGQRQGAPAAQAQQVTPAVGAPGALPAGSGGIVACVSESSASSIKLYKNQSNYNQWIFDYQSMLPAMGININQQAPGRGGPGDGRGGRGPGGRGGTGGPGDGRGGAGGPGRGFGPGGGLPPPPPPPPGPGRGPGRIGRGAL